MTGPRKKKQSAPKFEDFIKEMGDNVDDYEVGDLTEITTSQNDTSQEKEKPSNKTGIADVHKVLVNCSSKLTNILNVLKKIETGFSAGEAIIPKGSTEDKILIQELKAVDLNNKNKLDLIAKNIGISNTHLNKLLTIFEKKSTREQTDHLGDIEEKRERYLRRRKRGPLTLPGMLGGGRANSNNVLGQVAGGTVLGRILSSPAMLKLLTVISLGTMAIGSDIIPSLLGAGKTAAAGSPPSTKDKVLAKAGKSIVTTGNMPYNMMREKYEQYKETGNFHIGKIKIKNFEELKERYNKIFDEFEHSSNRLGIFFQKRWNDIANGLESISGGLVDLARFDSELEVKLRQIRRNNGDKITITSDEEKSLEENFNRDFMSGMKNIPRSPEEKFDRYIKADRDRKAGLPFELKDLGDKKIPVIIREDGAWLDKETKKVIIPPTSIREDTNLKHKTEEFKKMKDYVDDINDKHIGRSLSKVLIQQGSSTVIDNSGHNTVNMRISPIPQHDYNGSARKGANFNN